MQGGRGVAGLAGTMVEQGQAVDLLVRVQVVKIEAEVSLLEFEEVM